jgi:hypothetical protein
VYLTFKTLSSLRGKQVVHYRTEKETAFPEKMGMKSRGCIIKMILFFLVGGAYAFRGRGGGGIGIRITGHYSISSVFRRTLCKERLRKNDVE